MAWSEEARRAALAARKAKARGSVAAAKSKATRASAKAKKETNPLFKSTAQKHARLAAGEARAAKREAIRDFYAKGGYGKPPKGASRKWGSKLPKGLR